MVRSKRRIKGHYKQDSMGRDIATERKARLRGKSNSGGCLPPPDEGSFFVDKSGFIMVLIGSLCLIAGQALMILGFIYTRNECPLSTDDNSTVLLCNCSCLGDNSGIMGDDEGIRLGAAISDETEDDVEPWWDTEPELPPPEVIAKPETRQPEQIPITVVDRTTVTSQLRTTASGRSSTSKTSTIKPTIKTNPPISTTPPTTTTPITTTTTRKTTTPITTTTTSNNLDNLCSLYKSGKDLPGTDIEWLLKILGKDCL
ncbi:uncharacterized protein LOC141900004 [Tubulanus polymorphus]|uniref:uncharacterized protein LOC141900004 n=1 Tax=Tubulanus polymorphus TaxID=672921 RepID=UPI003DA5F0E2